VRDRRGDVVADELPQRGEDLLGQSDDVLLLDEGGFDVELGELGLAVGAEVLIAVAARDLVVAFHAGDLEQLLEQLRRLRQGVPGARLEASRDEEVAGTFRCGLRQGRGLDLDEAVRVEDGACGLVDVGAQTDRLSRARTAQVEVPVACRRVSSPTSPESSAWSETWNGRAAASESTSTVVSMTSISPVGRFGFVLPSGRTETVPVALTTVSLRSWWASSSRTTTCTIPEASRRSMKATPP
jgi:hypothetical protein